jgi:hypothetical protein
MAESGGDPNAGPNHPYHGLWQIGPGGPFDPVENARAAIAKFTASQATQGDGWLPWTTFTGYDTPNHERTFLRYLHGTTPTAGIPDAPCVPGNLDAPTAATTAELLENPNLVLTAGQRADLMMGGFDPRLLAIIKWMTARHRIVVTALRHDHHPGTNHEAGRAVDVGMVDGRLCNPYGPEDSCGQLLIALAQLTGPYHPTELIGGFDPDGAGPAWAQADHRNHLHVAFDL